MEPRARAGPAGAGEHFCRCGAVADAARRRRAGAPLAVYVLVIGAMIWRAAACALDARDDALIRWGLLAGAILFGFSDFLIGIHRFHQPLPGAAFPIILSYWAGQTLFAATAIRRKA